MTKGEQVLCFPSSLLDEVGRFQGISLRVNYLLDKILSSDKLEYRERASVENDPSWKQLIPYCVLMQDKKYFVYERGKSGGEKRLTSLMSIGVGGHINPIDGETISQSTYMNGFARELREEVDLAKGYSSEIVGLINNDSDAVGQVHFGVVHQLTIPQKMEIKINDPALQNGIWLDRLNLTYRVAEFETWSQLIIKDIL